MTIQFSRKMLWKHSRKSPHNKYNVRREDDDNDVSEDESSTENDSDDEALYDDGDLAFDFPDGDISERSKFEGFITEPCGCT